MLSPSSLKSSFSGKIKQILTGHKNANMKLGFSYSVFLFSFRFLWHFLTIESKYLTWHHAITRNRPIDSDWKIKSRREEGPIPEQRLVSMSPSMPLLLKNLPSKASSTKFLKFKINPMRYLKFMIVRSVIYTRGNGQPPKRQPKHNDQNKALVHFFGQLTIFFSKDINTKCD